MNFFFIALGALISTFIYYCIQYVIQTKREKENTKIINVDFKKRGK